MPLRTIGTVERSVKASPAAAITLAAGTSTVVLNDMIQQMVPNENSVQGYEVAARYIFNNTGAPLYYAYGTNQCDNVKTYHGVIGDQQQLNASDSGAEVSVYSVAGGKVAVLVLHRQDLHPHGGPGSLNAQRT